MYAFSRCFYPKRLTMHSGYTFFQYICIYLLSLTYVCMYLSTYLLLMYLKPENVYENVKCKK